MKKILLLISLLPVFLLTGCYDYTDINDRLFISGVAFDKEGNEYVVTAQALYSQSAKQESTTGGDVPVVYEGRGHSINAALADLNRIAPKYICLTHIQLIIVQEKIAAEGLKSVLDFFLRHYESRNQFDIIISREETASEILKVYTMIESFPAFDIIESLNISKIYYGIGNALRYDELISYLLKDGLEPALSSVRIVGNKEEADNEENIKNIKPSAQLMIDTIGVFKKDKLIGWLDKEESIGYNITMGRLNYVIIDFPCNKENQYIAVRLIRPKTSINIDLKSTKPKVEILLNAEARLTEISCDLAIFKSFDYIEKMINKQVETLINKALNAAQNKFNSDIIGLGKTVYQQNPTYWKKNEKKWDALFPTIDVKTKVKTTIIRRGILDRNLYGR